MFRLTWCITAILLGAFWPGVGWGQEVFSADEMRQDIGLLDSLFSSHNLSTGSDLEVLSSRDALLLSVQKDSAINRLDWALLVHQWLRSANDAHIRIRFEQMADSVTSSLPPASGELLREDGPWEAFAPGRGSAKCARLSWMQKTWPWLGALLPDAEVGQRSAEVAGEQDPPLKAGMAVVDHGAFSRWIIRDFSTGTFAEFKKSFRRCVRMLSKAEAPVLLDLRGNLGGLRTRRHAVLSFFLEPAKWPVEREASFGNADEAFAAVIPPMPALRVARHCDVPLAVLVDGLSFSASLLLADAVVLSGRGELFGVRPLGESGGCSGSPKDHVLPGSGLVVTCPTLLTSIGTGPKSAFSLGDNISASAADQAWKDAVRWLLSADLVSPR